MHANIGDAVAGDVGRRAAASSGGPADVAQRRCERSGPFGALTDPAQRSGSHLCGVEVHQIDAAAPQRRAGASAPHCGTIAASFVALRSAVGAPRRNRAGTSSRGCSIGPSALVTVRTGRRLFRSSVCRRVTRSARPGPRDRKLRGGYRRVSSSRAGARVVVDPQKDSNSTVTERPWGRD